MLYIMEITWWVLPLRQKQLFETICTKSKRIYENNLRFNLLESLRMKVLIGCSCTSVIIKLSIRCNCYISGAFHKRGDALLLILHLPPMLHVQKGNHGNITVYKQALTIWDKRFQSLQSMLTTQFPVTFN